MKNTIMKAFLKISFFIILLLSSVWYFKFEFKNEENLKAIAAQKSRVAPKICFKREEGVRIFTYIFHYIIPDKFVNPKNAVEYGNSLSPEYFENILKVVSGERSKGNIAITDFNRLAKYDKADCFPSKNIVIMTADDGWDDNYNYLFPLVKKYNIPFVLAIISGKVSKVAAEINNFANEDEIKQMLSSGLLSLASHTVDHFDLRKMSQTRKEYEVCKSKSDLENMFNVKVNTLVYPSGKYDTGTILAEKKCGYEYGFQVGNHFSDANELKLKPFEINRIRVNRKSDLKEIFDYTTGSWLEPAKAQRNKILPVSIRKK